MTVCTTEPIEYSRCHSRIVQANFGSGEIPSDGGVMLLQQADRLINLTERIASTANDPRNPEKSHPHNQGHALPENL